MHAILYHFAPICIAALYGLTAHPPALKIGKVAIIWVFGYWVVCCIYIFLMPVPVK